MNNSSENVNVTQSSPPICSKNTEPLAISWFKIVVYLLFLGLALLGNTLVICTVYRKKRMHTAPNFLIVNMAVSDLFMAFLCMIPTAVSLIRNDHSWMIEGLFGQVSCKFLLFSQGSSVACSIFSLTILAFERFLVIVFPLWNVVTIRGTLWSIASIWVAAIGISSPLFYATKVRFYGGVAYCIEDWAPAFDPERAKAIYTVVIFVLMYALPLVVIAVFYFAIAVKVWHRRSPGQTSSANREVLKESKKNVLKMSIAIVLAFAFCWFLMHLNMFLMGYSDVFKACGIPIWLQTTGFLLGYANSTINCCVYPTFSQEYRQGFKQSLKSLLPKCFRF